MASNIPTRRTTRNQRKAENFVPTGSNPSKNSQESEHSKAKTHTGQSSKLPVPVAGKASGEPSTIGASSKLIKPGPSTVTTKRKRTTPLAQRDDKNKTTAKKSSSLDKTKKADRAGTTSKKPIRRLPSRKSAVRHYSESEDEVPQIHSEPVQPPEHDDVRGSSPEKENVVVPDTHLSKRRHIQSASEPPPERHTPLSRRKGKQKEDQIWTLEQIQEEEDEEEDEGWEEIDARDAGVSAMVAEYAADIHEYLKEREVKSTPLANYMDEQPRLTREQRLILLDWLMSVFSSVHSLHPETWFLTVNIIDRFLSIRHVDPAKLQLVGVASLYLASKMEDSLIPALSSVVHWAYPEMEEAVSLTTSPTGVRTRTHEEQEELDQDVEALWGVKMAEFTKAEIYILTGLGWDLNYPSPMIWLRRGSKGDDYDAKPRRLGRYLMELASLDYEQIATKPSMLAAAALWLGRLMCGKVDWTSLLIHYTTYEEGELLATIQLMLNSLLRPPDKYPNLFKRWAGMTTGKISVACQIWARERWTEGTVVELNSKIVAGLKKYAMEQAKAAEEWARNSGVVGL